MNSLKLALVASILLCSAAETPHALAQQYVNGYTRSDGTYVSGYYRSRPDNNVWNNYSTRGNYNPYTGQTGNVNSYSTGNNTGSTMNTTSPNPFGYTVIQPGY